MHYISKKKILELLQEFVTMIFQNLILRWKAWEVQGALLGWISCLFLFNILVPFEILLIAVAYPLTYLSSYVSVRNGV